MGEICEEHIETFEEILKSLKEKTMVPALEILPEKQTDEVFQKETFQWLRDHRIKVWCNSLSLAKRLVYGAGYDDLNIVLGALGLPTPSWISDPNFIMISLIIVGVWSGIGYNTIILLAAIQGISQEMYESADLDGASEFQKFWKITLPLVSPSMFFLLTMGIMKAMRAFDMIYMFIGKDAWSTGGPLLEAVRTMVYGIYFNGFTRMDMGMASAESVVLFVMILIVTAIQFKLQDKWVNYD